MQCTCELATNQVISAYKQHPLSSQTMTQVSPVLLALTSCPEANETLHLTLVPEGKSLPVSCRACLTPLHLPNASDSMGCLGSRVIWPLSSSATRIIPLSSSNQLATNTMTSCWLEANALRMASWPTAQWASLVRCSSNRVLTPILTAALLEPNNKFEARRRLGLRWHSANCCQCIAAVFKGCLPPILWTSMLRCGGPILSTLRLPARPPGETARASPPPTHPPTLNYCVCRPLLFAAGPWLIHPLHRRNSGQFSRLLIVSLSASSLALCRDSSRFHLPAPLLCTLSASGLRSWPALLAHSRLMSIIRCLAGC